MDYLLVHRPYSSSPTLERCGACLSLSRPYILYIAIPHRPLGESGTSRPHPGQASWLSQMAVLQQLVKRVLFVWLLKYTPVVPMLMNHLYLNPQGPGSSKDVTPDGGTQGQANQV